MPPSPLLMRSPSMEPQVDSHRRGRSLESGISFKEQDDDLALFNEMQSREEDNFLLRSTNDFEDIFSSKVKHFPDLRLGISIPARGESSDLLNVEGDKNDYDWLLTPPDTPLFRSLDDESVAMNLVHDGRARSRPISISRSSTMEKRSSRGSPSPQRLSPSPQSGSSTFKGRPSSAPNATPVPLRPGTPSRRPSPPPVKASTPPPRTSTPPPRRTSVGSSTSVLTSGLRGTSPVRASRENSASPKIRAWQSNIPGFPLEAPPNLRTSLADRPASYVRGSSPASRTSSSSSKFRRQSMSPTASRSLSSSHSQERDRLSSRSKGSVVSSGDDDADSLQSIPVSIIERPVARRGVSSISNNKPSTFSKKPTKTFSPSSAPKRSFDSAMREMDRKSPQNMFRPLLSSVPSSTFYAGKASVAHRAMLSRNSSVTTSTSSEVGTSGAHDTEGSDLHQDGMVGESARAPFPEPQDEVFTIDEMGVTSEDIGHGAYDRFSNAQLGKPDKGCALASNTWHSNESGVHLCAKSITATSDAVDMQGDFVETDCSEKTLLCSICERRYDTNKVAENEHKICPECKQKGELLTTQNGSVHLMRAAEEPSTSEPSLVVPQLQTHSRSISEASLHEGYTLAAQDNASQSIPSFSDNSLAVPVGDETVQLAEEHRFVYNPSHSSDGLGEMHKSGDKSDSNMDLTECQGISVLLLKRSSSLKGPLIHGRTLNSSAMSYDDLFNIRDVSSSMRCSVGHGSISASSSVDLESARREEVLMQRQLSGRRADTTSQPQSTVSSLSGTSMHVSQGFGPSTNSHKESQEGSLEHEIRGGPEESVGGVQNVEESVFLESSLAEESMMPDNRVREIEIAEDSQCDLPAMSEVKNDVCHPSSPRSQIDLVSGEEFVDASVTTNHNKDVKGLSLDPSQSDHVDGAVEESVVTVEDQEHGGRTRSLTLEEATDTILFCSSIIHDLAYKATSVAIEKEKENVAPLEVSRLTVTIPEKRTSERRDPHGSTTRRKTQKARKTRAEAEPKSPLTKQDEKSDEHVVRNVGLPNNGDNMKPPKLESKCNCTIM